ncbi:MAG: DUF1367 family protein [Hyphomicrobiales bacterium]|nr:DUF1367 family protein [Hyphomicrobiales bacterium]
MKFIAQKHLGALRPTDEAGQDALRKLGNGELVTVEFRKSRNIKHHRMFWALMSIVHQNMDHDRYPTVEDLTSAIKIAAGLRTRIELPNGEVGFIPGSIAFHKMDQAAFSEFYDRVCDLIAKHFLPGVESDALKEEVEIMCGMRS